MLLFIIFFRVKVSSLPFYLQVDLVKSAFMEIRCVMDVSKVCIGCTIVKRTVLASCASEC